MRVAIAGAGNVGRSIAKELLSNGHEILLIEWEPKAMKPESVPGADWLLADACEIQSLEEAQLDTCDVTVAATGDDKANLVFSLLAKTEFSVPRTVARANHPSNEWMFDDVWGVDVGVSTPRMMAAMVDEAVSIGNVVRLHDLRGGQSLVELTLPAESSFTGGRVADLTLPGGFVMVAIVRERTSVVPSPDAELHAGDQLLFVGPADGEFALAKYLNPHAVKVAEES